MGINPNDLQGPYSGRPAPSGYNFRIHPLDASDFCYSATKSGVNFARTYFHGAKNNSKLY